jgi:hypothetical protein
MSNIRGGSNLRSEHQVRLPELERDVRPDRVAAILDGVPVVDVFRIVCAAQPSR